MSLRFIFKRPRFVSAGKAPSDPSWRAVHRAADAGISDVQMAFFNAVDAFQDALDVDLIEAALVSHGPEITVQMMPWQVFRHTFEEGASRALRATFDRAARSAERTGTIRKRLPGSYDPNDPRAVRTSAQLVGSLLFAADPGLQAALDQIIETGDERGLSTRDKAAEIAVLLRDRAGLDARSAKALRNFEQSLIAEGRLSKAKIAELVGERHEHYLRARALVIARHETMLQAAAGQMERWFQARDQGFIGDGAKKKRIVTNDERLCPICEPMAGQVVGLEEYFESPFNGARTLSGPIHTLCRCTERLIA